MDLKRGNWSTEGPKPYDSPDRNALLVLPLVTLASQSAEREEEGETERLLSDAAALIYLGGKTVFVYSPQINKKAKVITMQDKE